MKNFQKNISRNNINKRAYARHVYMISSFFYLLSLINYVTSYTFLHYFFWAFYLNLYFQTTLSLLHNPFDNYRLTPHLCKISIPLHYVYFFLIDLNKLMKYYGEDPNDKESKNEFFQPFIEFLAMFKKCAKENIEKEEMERVYEQKEELVRDEDKQ